MAKIDFSKPIGGGKAGNKKINIPSKKSINLAHIGEKKFNVVLAVLLSILIIVVVAFLAKVLVADKIIELDKIKAANASVKAQIEAEYAEIEAFADVEKEYAHYTYSGFSEAEKNKADRLDVINLMDKYIIPRGSVRTWVLNDNMLTLSIADLSLESLNTMVDQLENDSLVNFVTVTTASTPTENNQTVTASVTIYLNGPLSAAE